jgi:hypothetical protein
MRLNEENILRASLLASIIFAVTTATATIITVTCTGSGAATVCTYCIDDRCTTCGPGGCKEK